MTHVYKIQHGTQPFLLNIKSIIKKTPQHKQIKQSHNSMTTVNSGLFQPTE